MQKQNFEVINSFFLSVPGHPDASSQPEPGYLEGADLRQQLPRGQPHLRHERASVGAVFEDRPSLEVQPHPVPGPSAPKVQRPYCELVQPETSFGRLIIFLYPEA